MMVMTATTMMIPHVVSKMSTVKSCGVANGDDGDDEALISFEDESSH